MNEVLINNENKILNPHIPRYDLMSHYSFDPIVVGKWVDNRKIYRKVISVPKSTFGTGTATTGGMFSINHNITNLDLVVNKYVFWFDTSISGSNGGTRDFPGNFYSSNEWDSQAIVLDDVIRFELGSTILNRIRNSCKCMYVVLEYVLKEV